MKTRWPLAVLKGRTACAALLVGGPAAPSFADVNTRIDFAVSTDGIHFASTVDAVPGSVVEVLVTATYTGTGIPVGLSRFRFQPVVSNWTAGDTCLGFVNNGIGNNISTPVGVVDDSPRPIWPDQTLGNAANDLDERPDGVRPLGWFWGCTAGRLAADR
jgi:hypothetical protein